MNKVFGVLILLTLTSCVIDYNDNRLKIVNQTDKTICFDHEIDTILDVPSITKKEFFIGKRLEPWDTTDVGLPGSTTEWIKEVSNGKDSTLSIFVFDYDQVLANDWDTLRRNKKYRRLDYKLADLNKSNWTVTVH